MIFKVKNGITKYSDWLTIKDKSFFNSLINWSWTIIIIASCLQCLFFSEWENVVAVCIVLLGWAIVTNTVLNVTIFKSYPLSSFLILGFSLTQLYFPLIFTLLEGKPVIYNLELPYEVFIHIVLALIVLVISHRLYHDFFSKTTNKLRYRLMSIKLYEPPNVNQLWLMGLIGVFSMLISAISSGGQDSENFLLKFTQGLYPFSYAPFFIPFWKLYGGKKESDKYLNIKLIGFIMLLLATSVIRNSRGAFMFGFTSLGFTYALGIILQYFKTNIFSARNLLIGTVSLWLFTGPVADIGTAMVIVRGERSNVSGSELFDLTLKAYQDKEAIALYRSQGLIGEISDWDERYLDNILLARFSNIKFNDLSLVAASRIDPEDTYILDYTIDHFLATFPQPVLDITGIKVDKKKVNSTSIGDILLYKSGVSAENSLGGFKTGNLGGAGMAAFGWWYLLILGVGMIPVFILFDSFYIKMAGFKGSLVNNDNQVLRFSMCGLLALTSIILFLPVESVHAIFIYLLRGWIQLVILYYFVFVLTKRILNFL